jgi:hypothetical protein
MPVSLHVASTRTDTASGCAAQKEVTSGSGACCAVDCFLPVSTRIPSLFCNAFGLQTLAWNDWGLDVAYSMHCPRIRLERPKTTGKACVPDKSQTPCSVTGYPDSVSHFFSVAPGTFQDSISN